MSDGSSPDRSWPRGRARKSALAALGCVLIACSGEPPPARDLPEFEERLERLRLELRVPGFSAGIVKDQRLVWARGFGLADVESGVPAAAGTSYHIASVTKTFASTVLLQLVEEGKVNLDDPVSQYGVIVPSTGIVRVKHLLTHTSEGVPGETFRYNGDRFGLLDSVISGASGRTFGALVVERVIVPLALEHTAPNPSDTVDFALAGHDRESFERNLAKGYAVDGEGRPKATAYPTYFGTAAGLISSVPDLAAWSNALDGTALLREETKAIAWSPAVSTKGDPLPYGLGWFVQRIGDAKLVWHYGYWVANSSLLIKAPEQRLAFIILANSDGLSASYPLGAGDLMSSPFGREFVRAFVLGKAPLPEAAREARERGQDEDRPDDEEGMLEEAGIDAERRPIQ
jgi:CubicO group peptidase (beta-lactamase class C family)